MSFEGYFLCFCENGHRYYGSPYDENSCACGGREMFSVTIDQTNGDAEEAARNNAAFAEFDKAYAIYLRDHSAVRANLRESRIARLEEHIERCKLRLDYLKHNPDTDSDLSGLLSE